MSSLKRANLELEATIHSLEKSRIRKEPEPSSSSREYAKQKHYIQITTVLATPNNLNLYHRKNK